jgi:hypothetical protein
MPAGSRLTSSDKKSKDATAKLAVNEFRSNRPPEYSIFSRPPYVTKLGRSRVASSFAE